mmetsp:Transcript_41921/g.111016  ORF Transcript_41921/g.111016 Transcript_41921/m.111016 type:complete len:263 (-) Transcript_41921:63-851(-)
MLAGRLLQPPELRETGWRQHQKFTESDDPDRTLEEWRPPHFLVVRDPAAQREKTTVEDLRIQGHLSCASSSSFARVVRGVLDEEDCAELISRVNAKGFTPALLNTGRGRQQFEPAVRDGHRVIVDSVELTSWLLEVLRPSLPEELDGATLVDLNERCRFLCYTPGQEFAPHCDGRYTRPQGHPHVGDHSAITVQLYLHDVPAEHGGATTFLPASWDKPDLPYYPEAGSVLLFTQDLLHEGSTLGHGFKYTLRTEAMYREPKP